MSTAVSASLLAHGLHISMVLLGLWGLAALLLPHALDRLRPSKSRPYDVHEARVRALRAAAASGGLGTPTAVLERDTITLAERPRPDAMALGLPLVVVASAAAAGIHAAVAPPHFEESTLFGLFFLGSAVAQLAWAAAAYARPTARLMQVGALGNAAVLGLWAVTRTFGLPWGLLPRPEEIGGWDITCAAWEVTVVVGAVWLLRDGIPRRCPGWLAWHPAARGALGFAGVSLMFLSFMGGHS